MDTTELQNQAIEIRDAENEGENTATKVGTLLVNIIQVLAGTVTEESLTETLEAVEEVLQRDYASLENGTVKWHQRGVIFLKSMGSALDNIDGGSYTPTLEIGDTWFSPTSGGLTHKTQDGTESWYVRPDAVYINSHTLRVYKWASGSMVELGSGKNPVMIDYMVSKTLDSIAVGEVFWQSSNSKLVIKTGESSVRMFSPDPSVIYCARDTKSLMFWDTTTSTWQSVGGGSSSGLAKVISNIELVNSKVNTLINALANIAFKQLPKPEMTELDWGGAKHTVTINNTLSGCSADKSGTQQVSEGSALVVTITADSGKLLRSVSASSGTVVIAANKTTATVTLTVNDDVTLTIQASATNADSFTASISDPRVSGTGAMSGITEGSSWTSVLSLNNTADPSDDITNVTVEMVGGGSDSISAEKVNGEWTVQTGYVTGNITITVTVATVEKRTITVNKGSNVTVDDGSGGAAPSRIGVGENVTLRFTPATGYTAAVWRVTEGSTERIINGANSGVALAENNGVLTLTINNVQDNIVVDSVEVENNHYMSYGNETASVSGGAGEGWGVMKLLIPSNTVSIDYFRGALSNGENTSRCHISFRSSTDNMTETEVHNKASLHQSVRTTDGIDRIWVSVPVANMHKIMIAVYDSNDNKTVLYKGLDYDELYGKYGIVYGKYYDNSGVLTTGSKACMTSPLAADKSHDFKGVLPSNKGAFVCADSNGEYLGQYTASSTEKALSPRSSTVQGVADNFAAWIMNFSDSNGLSNSYLKDDNTSEYIFKGEAVQTT